MRTAWKAVTNKVCSRARLRADRDVADLIAVVHADVDERRAVRVTGWEDSPNVIRASRQTAKAERATAVCDDGLFAAVDLAVVVAVKKDGFSAGLRIAGVERAVLVVVIER